VCGIAGIKLFNKIASKTDEQQMKTALVKQNHRGPDSTNVLIDGEMVFGHNRLSIIDTNERSNQPFQDVTGRFSLVFNGEIYNFQELKKEMQQNGILFSTTSDTEVLFHLLIQKKSAALDDLRGCFAFAFYDKNEDYLLLARDRMGINPLLYSISNERIVFGSELSIFKELGVHQSLSNLAINYYFQYTYIPAPYTIFNEVQKLLPGHYLELKGDNYKIERYWSPKSENKFIGTFEKAKSELRKKVEFAVKSQLEADVPIGSFLSGGVDSSIVSALIAEEKSDLHTFSVSFGDQKKYDESEFALKVAKHIHSNHHVIALKENDFRNNFNEILNSFDEPFADSSAIAMWFLSKETAKHLKVALSGDGADELFGGYNKHLAYYQQTKMSLLFKKTFTSSNKVIQPFIKNIKPKIAHKINKYSELINLKWPENYWFLASNIGENSKNKLLKHPLSSNHLLTDYSDDLNSFLLKDQQFVLSNDMLKKVDLMSMRHSLEVRTPFMDKDLVKFANSLPVEWKLNNKIGKYILKEAFKDKLPKEIFLRKKQGFEVPLNAWIKNNWNELIPDHWFEKKYIENQNIFNFEGVMSLKNNFKNNIGTSNQELWAYIVFQNWFQEYNKNV
jgi:asparagine synthase (glutamine-hydrolysing)